MGTKATPRRLRVWILPCGIFLNQHEFLVAVWLADRYHQPPVGLELLDQGHGDIGGRGGNDDTVVGRMFRPAIVAVAGTHFYVVAAQRLEQT